MTVRSLYEAKPRPGKVADIIVTAGEHVWMKIYPSGQFHLVTREGYEQFVEPEPDPDLPAQWNRPGAQPPESFLMAALQKDGSLRPDSGMSDPGPRAVVKFFFDTVFVLCEALKSWIDVNWFLDHYMNELSGKIDRAHYPKIIEAIRKGLIRSSGKKIPWPSGVTGGPVGVIYHGVDADDKEYKVRAIFHDVGDLVLGNRAFSVRVNTAGEVTEFRRNSLSPYAMMEAFEEWDGEDLASALEMVGAKSIAKRFKVDRDEHEANGSILPKTIAAMQSPVKTPMESTDRTKQARAHLLEMRRREKWNH